MPEFDAYHVALPVLVLIICIASYEKQKSDIKRGFTNQIRNLDLANKQMGQDLAVATADVKEMTETCNKLTKQVKERGPSVELREFLKDIEVKGYGVVRIDPDDVFYRGRN